uniref:Uncharacterized protein n=1 Tax=Oryza glumipatula TaxID=40148 RepID=A0A0E0A2C7_9ORYZ
MATLSGSAAASTTAAENASSPPTKISTAGGGKRIERFGRQLPQIDHDDDAHKFVELLPANESRQRRPIRALSIRHRWTTMAMQFFLCS